MKFSNFASSLARKLAGPLEVMGFKKQADDLFVRFKHSHEINVISLQKHSAKSMVSVNFGVHYDFLPKLGSAELPLEGQLGAPECEVIVRLTPDSTSKDYWWPISTESIDEIAELIFHRSEDFFCRYDINGDISSISPKDISESMPDVVGMLTKVRACLVLARIHEESGESEKAASFARLGIQVAGMAVGPKKALRELLERVDP